MVANARHRVGNRHALQSRAVKERDVADNLDVFAPVDRLQRRTVVEQRLVIVKTKFSGVIVPIISIVVCIWHTCHFNQPI